MKTSKKAAFEATFTCCLFSSFPSLLNQSMLILLS